MTAIPLTDAETATLSRWVITGRSGLAWLASGPPPAKVRAVLIKSLDRGGPATALARALGEHLGEDPVRLYAENWPRKAARLAAEARGRGDDPHAGVLQAALTELMRCSNCGRQLDDPVSIERGIGRDCWDRIDPGWRAAITARVSGQHELPDESFTPERTPMTGHHAHTDLTPVSRERITNPVRAEVRFDKSGETRRFPTMAAAGAWLQSSEASAVRSVTIVLERPERFARLDQPLPGERPGWLGAA